MEFDPIDDRRLWDRSRQAIVVAVIMTFCADVAAQTIAPAPGPDGRSPSSAPSPAATATSPGTSPTSAVAPASPAPESRSTSPGASALPPGSVKPTIGVPARVVAPDAPATLPDPVDPTDAVAPSDQARRIRPPSNGPGTRIVPSPVAPDSLPPAPVPAPPASPAVPASVSPR